MSDSERTQPNPGEALVLAGIKPMSPWQLLHFQSRRMTPELAQALGVAFGTTAQFWLNAQAAYDYGDEHGK